ncbi:MAG: hypothetical protein U0547_04710 [Dehalococcoidia bacterium]
MRPPVIPLGRKLPWVAAALGVLAVAYGLLRDDPAFVLLGAVVAVAVLIAFPLASRIAGSDTEPPSRPE